MTQLLQIFWMVLQTLPMFLFHPFFWLVVAIVFFQYRRSVSMEKKVFGAEKNNVWKQTFLSIVTGFGGGIFASAMLLGFGLSLNRIGIAWLWPVAILLLLIHPRLLCFAYAGGIVGMFALVARAAAYYFPSLAESTTIRSLLEISLPELLLLIAVLHLTEALLIYLSGHWGSSPVYLKTPQGKLVGAFSMQRFWPLPVIGLLASVVPESAALLEGSVPMPDWWPLFAPVLEPGYGEKLIYIMLPLVVGLGYGDLAVSTKPRQKSIFTARNLALYSVFLLVLALLAELSALFLLPAVLFAPFGHECVVHLGSKTELQKKPLFDAPTHGARVMTVLPGSPASEAGFQDNDIVLRVNEQAVNSPSDFWEKLRESYIFVQLAVLREGSITSFVLQQKPYQRKHFGLIFVPEQRSSMYIEMRGSLLPQRLKGIIGRFSRVFGRRR